MDRKQRWADWDTLPKLLLRGYEVWGGSRVAMTKKNFGVWRKYTWGDYYQAVKYFSLGLSSLGLKNGDRVAIVGDNDPEWYWAYLAVQAAGGIAVGVYTDSSPPEVKYIVEHSDSRFVVAKDQEQVDKILLLKDELPDIAKVIYWDPKGLWDYDDPILAGWQDIRAIGKDYEQSHPGLFEQNVNQSDGDKPATICYTSGTTALPKGAVISHRSLIEEAQSWLDRDPMYGSDDYLSFIAPAWATEQSFGIVGSLLTGMRINFPEEPETVQEDTRETAPQMILYNSRLWENVASTVQARMIDADLFKRSLYNLFLPVGYKMADLNFERKRPDLFWQVLNKLAFLIVFRALLDKLGLLKSRLIYTAGAALGAGIIRFLHAIGIKIKQAYGFTELGGLGTLEESGDQKSDSIGLPLPGIEVRISGEGELVFRTECFSGYHKDAEATKQRLRDGWLYSGDGGFIDEEGHVIYLDRVADFRELAGGRSFAPQYIENRLKFSPYVKDLIVVGGQTRPYITAIINIDFDNVGKWAEANHLAYTTFVDLSQKAEVAELISRDIKNINKRLPEWSRIKKYVLLHKEFDPDEAELTRTRKLRRSFMEERYVNLIEAMYQDKSEEIVEAEVKYRDGRMGMVKTVIKMRMVD